MAANRTATNWFRIPDGTKVRHCLDGYEGLIDGLTEIVSGASLNPDGKTVYRINVGAPVRKLAAEENLLFLIDRDGLVMIGRDSPEYRRYVTGKLREVFSDERFVT